MNLRLLVTALWCCTLAHALGILFKIVWFISISIVPLRAFRLLQLNTRCVYGCSTSAFKL